MSAYKKLNKQDAYITTYTAHKYWAVSGSELLSHNIDTALATGSYLNKYQQLYYTTKISGSISSHLFDYSEQTTLHYSESRYLTTGSFAFQFSPTVYGTAIKPDDGFSIQFSPEVIKAAAIIKKDYVLDGYVDEYAPLAYSEKPIPPKPSQTKITKIIDDGEGNLHISGSSPRLYVGDIVYNQGSAIVTDAFYASLLRMAYMSKTVWPQVLVTWKSSLPIFTHNYHCRIRESEYNFTYNPSALSSSLKTVYDNNGDIYSVSASISNGYLNNNVTGSTFQPYFTTVGLYNDANQLIAVGKISQPVPKSANTDMTIIVKIDI